jgi:multidrug efflux system membrane fusion protein
MSISRQIFLTAVLLLLVGGGWALVQRPAFLFGDSAGQQADGAGPGGGPPAAGQARGGPPGAPGGGAPRGGGAPAPVVVAAVAIDDTGTDVRAIGTLAAARAVTVFPQVTGVVTEVAFKPGSPVKAGDVLIRLDDADQRSPSSGPGSRSILPTRP